MSDQPNEQQVLRYLWATNCEPVGDRRWRVNPLTGVYGVETVIIVDPSKPGVVAQRLANAYVQCGHIATYPDIMEDMAACDDGPLTDEEREKQTEDADANS